MLRIFIASVARCTTVFGLAFILGEMLPRMPNKMCRFLFLFAVGVSLKSVINYVYSRNLGYPEIGWTGALMIALLFATWLTFWPPQADNLK
jgi:hypothetical protein